jgi:hypothetical protein
MSRRFAQEGTSMQRKRRMLTASRLCLLGIAVSASSFSVFAQCPNDSFNCDAQVRTISAFGGTLDAVYGASSIYGVVGISTGGFPSAGVLGVGSGNGIGVKGESLNGNGVYGQSSSPNDSGVWGSNGNGGYGVSGSTISDTASGVWGLNYGGGPGVRGTAFGSGLAGAFDGTVSITGDLNVSGAKNAVVETASFGKRKLYAVESPENWFEDFGQAKLVNGRAVITIERVFAQTVNTEGDYHVFVTPKGNCRGLYVAHQGPGSFEVRELNKGKANITFDYRIVARRRAYEQVRLAEFKEAGEGKQLAAGLAAKPAPFSPTAAACWAATPFPSSSQPGNKRSKPGNSGSAAE